MKDDPKRPSSRRLGRVAIAAVAILVAIMIVIFVGRNLWHGEELEEDQAAGANVAMGNNFH